MELFTSDLHLGHENVLKHRTMFDTIEEMNETLINNWNKKVHKSDDVYIVGDFSYRSKIPVETYLERLKGKKHLILGNHDPDWLKQSQYEKLSQYFCSINSFHTFKKIRFKLHYVISLCWSGVEVDTPLKVLHIYPRTYS